MKALTILFVAACLMNGLAAFPAMASISVLVDEIHGRPLSDELAAALPMCNITPLTSASFPIIDLIDSGTITEFPTEILFTLPEGAETLYLQFMFNGSNSQLPYITLYGPDGVRLGSHCEGALHFENPEPGQYRMTYSSWTEVSASYKIGTGPPLFTAELLDNFDLVCNLWDDTMLMFRGELPRYSALDEARLTAYLEGGGGFLLVRQPLIEMALKPIINIYAEAPVQCDVNLGFPGQLTYAEPPCQTESAPAGTWLHWNDMSVEPDQPAQILYEGKLRRQTDWMQLKADGDQPTVFNRTAWPLHELHLIRHEGGDSWRLVRMGALAAGSEAETHPGELLSGGALKADLENIIRDGGRRAGLYASECEEFLAHYHWADRWMNDALVDGRWCGLYRIDTAAYDSHIVFQEEPAAQEKVRTMWIWASGLGREPLGIPSSDPTWPLPTPHIGASAPIIYHEFGVQYQRGSGSRDSQQKDFDFLGWSFYDGAALVDPTDNCGEAACPWFTMSGGHPDAAAFMVGVSAVLGYSPGAITAPWSEQILIGDDDAMTDDWFFAPGTYPPVSVARSVGAGRAAAIHTLTVLDEELDNRVFLDNVVMWLAQYVSGTPDIPSQVSHIQAVTPNPFNPRLTVSFSLAREQHVKLTVCDLSGKRVATLLDEVYSGGTHAAVWNGQDDRGRDLSSGGYLIHMETPDARETRKAMLVR